MSRPKNVLVVNGNLVLSLSPGKLKEFVALRAAGTTLPVTFGKEVGTILADVTALDTASATDLLATLTATELTANEVVEPDEVIPGVVVTQVAPPANAVDAEITF